MVLVDAVSVVTECFRAAGWDNVHPDVTDQTEQISSEALAGEDYIWVEEEQGITPHVLYADRPVVRVILYAESEALSKGRQLQQVLAQAVVNGTRFPSGGIHRVFTLIRPYRQDITGIPPGVVRVSALYELVISTQEKWV